MVKYGKNNEMKAITSGMPHIARYVSRSFCMDAGPALNGVDRFCGPPYCGVGGKPGALEPCGKPAPCCGTPAPCGGCDWGPTPFGGVFVLMTLTLSARGQWSHHVSLFRCRMPLFGAFWLQTDESGASKVKARSHKHYWSNYHVPVTLDIDLL